MLRLNTDQYDRALEVMAAGLVEAEGMGLVTRTARAGVMLEALAKEFDIEAMDPGPEPEEELDEFERVHGPNMNMDRFIGRCRVCLSEDHTGPEHDQQLMDRIAAEVDTYNRRLI